MTHSWTNSKWGGKMNKTCVYYCEGEDDLKLVDALKVSPSRILPGKSKKLNVVQTLIPKSILVGIKPGSNVVLVFDTDVTTNLDVVKKNIQNIKMYCQGVKIVYLLQVKKLEDELVRCTDIKSVLELTKSKSISNFKADFRKMKEAECRHTLERHKLDVDRLWTTTAPADFDFAERNSEFVKL